VCATFEERVIPISVAVYALIIFKSHRSGYLQAKAKSEKAAKSAKEVKKVKVSLINMKRAQNAGIALARIRYSYSELRQKIQVCADELCFDIYGTQLLMWRWRACVLLCSPC
jgi:hypothetical protein